MTPQKINALFKKLSVAIPNPETELNHRNPFELLIAVILSAQATDVSVNKVTPALFEHYPDPYALSKADEQEVLVHIKTIGLAKTKAKNIIKTAQMLVERHQGKIPQEREALESLAGVGRKTANVVLNTAFHQPVIAVDTHVLRVSNRTGLAVGETPLDVEEALMKAVPKQWKLDAHHYLILHGRYVCKAKKPDCPACPIALECEYPEKIS